MSKITSHTVTERKRKSRYLAEKRASAEERGVTLYEGAILAVKDGKFSAYVWQGTELVELGYGTIL